MGPDSWEEVATVFDAVAGLGPDARASVLNELCAGRPSIRAEVESLLAAHDGARGLLERVDSGRNDGPLASDPHIGTMAGAFRLVARIGQGGMGTVYLGERVEGGFTQRAAVKLIDWRPGHADALRRFHVERQALASLNHPRIVGLIDGGFTPAGQPYLVMEHVEGIPITTFCRANRLGLDARLELFVQVCGAVRHAHQHSVVHRDLKPGNILVTAEGAAKVLDFGVAKLTEDAAQAGATATGLLQPLTPNYASPEQLLGRPVTVASDIYALGVLLYELLTGGGPYDTTGKRLDEVLALVTDTGPRRPSAAPADAADELPYALKRLRGDLDAIVLKAMSREPERRYGSAQELADDVQRFVSGEVITAREPSLAYLASSLIRRHTAAFSAATVSVLALAAALGVSLWQTQVARAERNLATERFNDLRAIANALIFKIHDGVQPLPGSTPVRELIVAEALTYLERLSASAGEDEALGAELARGYHRIATVQGLPSHPNLGDRDGARDNVQKAIALLAPIASRPDAPEDLVRELGQMYLSASSILRALSAQESRQALDAAIAVVEPLVARAPSDASRRLLGSVYFQAAFATPAPGNIPAWHRALTVFDALLAEAPDDPDRQRNVALVHKYLGGAHEFEGRYGEALTHHQRAYALDAARLAARPDDRRAQFDVAIDFSNLGFARFKAGQLAEAAAAYEASLDMRRSLADSDPRDVQAQARVAYAHSMLGEVYSHLGRHRDAVAHGREAVRLGRALPDSGNLWERGMEAYRLGASLRRAAQPEAACREFAGARRIVEQYRARDGESQARMKELSSLLEGTAAMCDEAARPGAQLASPPVVR